MHSHPAFELIDKKFVLAVQIIQEAYQNHPEKNSLSDNRIGLIISPNNRYVVKKIKKGDASINHYQLLTFASHFNIPIEYFYYEKYSFEFSFLKNDPSSFVSEVHVKSLDTHADEKIDAFIDELKQYGYEASDLIKERLKAFKTKTIETLEGVPYSKATAILDAFFSDAFMEEQLSTVASKYGQPTEETKGVEETNNTNKYLENLVKTTQEMNTIKDQLIESKDRQIELLTKDNKRLEKLVSKK